MKDIELIGVVIIGLFVVVAGAYAAVGAISGGGYVVQDTQAAQVQQGADQGTTIPIVDGKQYAKIGIKDYNYDPSDIRVKVGIPVKLEFDTTQIRGCLSTVRVPKEKIVKHLTAADDVIEFTPAEAGVYTFSCGMGMAGGQITAEL